MRRRLLCIIITLITMVLQGHAKDLLPSPVIDKSTGAVTFRCPDNGYDELYLKASFLEKKAKMTRVGDIWTYTSEPLPSNMYTYCFSDDDDDDDSSDDSVLDPANPDITRDIDDTLNYFIVDGQLGNYLKTQNVPHGTVEKVWYPSSFHPQMPERRMLVYLPPGYKRDTTQRYPVLYMLHGTGGDETTMCDIGRMTQIMDNMLAEKKIQPMIVVMPNGMADQDAAPGESRYMDSKASHSSVKSWMGRTEAAFPTEVMAYVDQHYRTIADKQHRAIAGISMGGMHAAAIAANNPDSFDYVGLFSAQGISGLTNGNIKLIKSSTKLIGKVVSAFPKKKSWQEKYADGKMAVSDIDIYQDLEEKILEHFSQNPKLHYIAIGKDDGLKRFIDSWRKFLDKNNCPYYYNESEGGHSWENWHQYTVDFLMRIFTEP